MDECCTVYISSTFTTCRLGGLALNQRGTFHIGLHFPDNIKPHIYPSELQSRAAVSENCKLHSSWQRDSPPDLPACSPTSCEI